MEGVQAQAGRRHAWDAERKQLIHKLAATKGGGGSGGGGGGGGRYGTGPATPGGPTTDVGFAGVANTLLRGLFSKPEAPHRVEQPGLPPDSGAQVGASTSNWPSKSNWPL